MGAQGVLDLCERDSGSATCDVCGTSHPGQVHEGCAHLAAHLRRVGARMHLFGHAHSQNGVEHVDGMVCANSAMDLYDNGAHVFNVVLPVDREDRGLVEWPQRSVGAACVLA